MPVMPVDDLEVFVRVTDAKSLSGAAKSLGLSKSAVSKQLARLEAALGARLLNRTTRRLSLTEAGATAYQHGLRIAEEITALKAGLAGLHERPSGLLRVSAPVAFGNLHLSGMLPEFQRRFPGVDVVLSLNDRYVDIADEGFDVVVRLTSQPADNVVARALARVRYVLCAAPAYLQLHSTPYSPPALAEHNCLVFGSSPGSKAWTFALGEHIQDIEVRGHLVMNSSEALRAAALDAGGIALLPTYAVSDDLRKGSLVRLLSEFEISGVLGSHIYAVYLPNRYLMPKVRVFIDFLVEALSAPPPWDRGIFQPDQNLQTTLKT